MSYRFLNDPDTGRAGADLVLRLADGAYLPADPGNADWQAYRAWLDAGNMPEPAPWPVPPRPAPVSDRQIAQALALRGRITQDEAILWAARGDLPAALAGAVAGLPDDARFTARMLLSAATTYERDHPLADTLGAVLGYDAAALDALWEEAARLL